MSKQQQIASLDSAFNLETKKETHRGYKSGAIYNGQIIDNNKFGKGVFVWPNGDRYDGSYEFNYRHGYGIQTKTDGSSYEGNFIKDKKSGKGTYKSKESELYSGTWFRDFRHGLGEYKWKDGNLYEGMFFENFRDGFGKLTYQTGNVFKGLYKHDMRFGPGVLIYKNNKTRDIGFWCGDKLIRILITQEIDYQIPDIDEIDRIVHINSWYDRETLLYEILNPQNMFSNKYYNEQLNTFMREDPYIEDILLDKREMVDEFLRICAPFEIDLKLFHMSKFIQVPNITRNLIEIFKHLEKYSNFKTIAKKKYGLDLEIFENTDFDTREDVGSLENASREFLKASLEENLEKLKELKPLVNVNVCDNNGLNALLIAIIKCNTKIIDYLLDNGANVNHILDNGLTGLMICVNKYYNSDKFLPNTALKHQDLPLMRKLSNQTIVLNEDPTEDTSKKATEIVDSEIHSIIGLSTKSDDFESVDSVLRYKLRINEDLINKYASILSTNDHINLTTHEENLRVKAAQLYVVNQVGKVIELLLRRGANPSASQIPYPALCFAVAAGDTKVVKLLLEKGANCNDKMPMKFCSLTPLALACGVLGETGPELVELLLKHNADPNEAADIGREYLSMIEEDWVGEPVPDELINYISGRTPLHIACARNDPYAAKVVKLLIENQANPNLICNGQSPLSLAIASGNRDAVDILVKSDLTDISLPLTNGVGSALCVVASTLYEHHWSLAERLRLVDKLIHYGGNILQPVAFGPRRYVGTAIDYGWYMHNSDVRLAQTPYHSLTHAEREVFNSRKELLNHMGKRYREKMVEFDKSKQLSDKTEDTYFGYSKWGPAIRNSRIQRSGSTLSDNDAKNETSGVPVKKLPKWCYYCGRSVSVKLTVCSRCKRVSYCSNFCKQKAWNEFHKKECSKMRALAANDNFLSNNNTNDLAQTFVSTAHNTFLSEASKSKATSRRDNEMGHKQISFFLDNEKLGNGEQRPISMKSSKSGKSGKSLFSKQFEQKMSILEKKLGRKRFHNDGISMNPLYNAQDNYSFN